MVTQYGSCHRWVDFPGTGGIERIHLGRDFVIPTGRGWFFAPPIGGVHDVLAPGSLAATTMRFWVERARPIGR